MLSYQHGYHAGNHADILKHAVLALCLEQLQQKPAPLLCIDTHAGRGRYDLGSEASLKTGEAERGIRALNATQRALLPAYYQDSLAHRHGGDRRATIRNYPGSCQLMADHLRPADRAVFCEKHPQEFGHLQAHFTGQRGIQVANGDGFAALTRHLPPASGRALVLIDPSYETAQDYTQVAKAVAEVHRRCRGGVVLVWYPLLPAARALMRRLDQVPAAGVDACHLTLRVQSSRLPGLPGSAIFALNPPWQLGAAARPLFSALLPALAADADAAFHMHPVDQRG
ncbi:MAG: 23S rRNA (adenine(2030)-N(6))-methyltransferase RlmJ [Oceanococcaceae bacterium]